MRWIVTVALALCAGFLFVELVDIYPDNYVKIYVDTYVVEMSFAMFLFVVFGLVMLAYLFFAMLNSAFRFSTFFSRWRNRKAHINADAALGAGYLSLIKGDWRHAEKKLLSKSDNSGVPYINYLAAAQAAQEQSQFDRRDEYLNLAYQAAPKERLAIGLAKARLHHLAGQHQQAEATLDDIADIGRKNSQYIAMLLQTYQATANWEKVHDLLPSARKLDALPEAMLQDVDSEAHLALMLESQDKQAVWKQLPKEQQKKPENILAYASEMIEKGDSAGAEKTLRTALKSVWSDELVRLYGKLPSSKPAKLRRNVEGWLMARPESAELNLAAGRLAIQESNEELASSYLEKAIELGQLPRAYSLLGELYEAGNDSGRALQLYRSGLLNVSKLREEKALAPQTPEAGSNKQGELVVADQS